MSKAEPILTFAEWSQAAAERSIATEDEREALLEELALTTRDYLACERYWVGVLTEEIRRGDTTSAKAHGLRCAEMRQHGREPLVARLGARSTPPGDAAGQCDETLPIRAPATSDALPFREGTFRPPARALTQLERAGLGGDSTLPAHGTTSPPLPFTTGKKHP